MRQHGNRTGTRSTGDAMLGASLYSTASKLDHVINNAEPDNRERGKLLSPKIFEGLERTERVTLILRYVWGFNQKEIGHCLGVTESMVSKILKTISDLLRDTINKQPREGQHHGRNTKGTETKENPQIHAEPREEAS